MLALHWADVSVIVVYLVLCTFIGLWAGRRIRSVGDFFMPRRFGKTMMITYAFGAGSHADQAVGVASKTYTSGLSGIWYQWLWLFPTPFYWLIAAIMRRFRAITTADVFDLRYSRGVAMLYSVIGSINLMASIGMMLKGSSAALAGCSDAFSAEWTMIAMTVLFVAYGAVGGLSAAILTDFVQGILTIVFSIMLLPPLMSAVGGMAGLHQRIADPGMFSLVVPGNIGVFYIVMIAFNGLIGIVTQPHTMGNCAAGRTEMDGRVGFMGGNFVKRFCTIAWCLTGLAAVAYFADRKAAINPDNVYGLLAGDFLPKILPGLLGVFISALLATVMDSCGAFMISSSALLTENIYKPLRPGRTQKHYVLVGRVLTVLVVAGGLAFAYWLPNVIKGLEIVWKIPAIMGIAFWMGMLWRRTNSAGAWASTAVAFGLMLLTEWQPVLGWLKASGIPAWIHLPQLVVDTGKRLEMNLPWQMTLYLSGGVLAGAVASLLTAPPDRQKLERYYGLIYTPVAPDEKPSAVCQLPEGVAPARRRNLLPFASLELPLPSRTSIAGFLVGCLLVAIVIYLVYLIAHPW